MTRAPAPPLHPITMDGDAVRILDQTRLPWSEAWLTLETCAQAAHAIRGMQVRGAPLIGATAAWGMALAMREDASDDHLANAAGELAATRPTAVNLAWALARMNTLLRPLSSSDRPAAANREARRICAEDARANAAIGQHGLELLRPLARAGRPLRLMTHCNAGILATTAHGTATAPIYAAHAAGLEVEVFVSETRPRNQGMLTAWELDRAGIPCALMADNASGHLLMSGEVDAVLVGADRIAANGDTANKVGTLLKALAAREAAVPFYVCAPVSTIDHATPGGASIPIEEREALEVLSIQGLTTHGTPATLSLRPGGDTSGIAASNPAFDVTPARFITAIITERGPLPPDGLSVLQR